MLKIRVQGTRNEIKWLLKLIRRSKSYDVMDVSEILSNKGTKKYKHVYFNIQKVTPEERRRRNIEANTKKVVVPTIRIIPGRPNKPKEMDETDSDKDMND